MRHKAPMPFLQTKAKTTIDIDREKLSRAMRILGTKTDMETVDRALEIVLVNAEIESAVDANFGKIPDFKV